MLDAIATFIGILVSLFIVVVICSFPTMWLWNWLCPELFHLPTIDLWQAAGLSSLSSILFKSYHGKK